MKWLKFFFPVKSINNETANELMKNNSQSGYILLDVREPAEYEEKNITGSRLIPLGNLWNSADELDKDKTILVLCRSGNRSKLAARILAVKGFANVLNISGGLSAWNMEPV